MHSDVRYSRVVVLLLSLISLAQAFYIPGWSIKSYRDGEVIPLFVNKVYSDHTQLQYAFSELPFVCPPNGRKHGTGLLSGTSISLNLGEVLRGDRIVVSDYELAMDKDDQGHFLCSREIDRAGLRKAIEIVKDGYVAEWIVDNLPGATSFVTTDGSRKYYAAGFKMGYQQMGRGNKPRYFLNNHVTIVIRYHKTPSRNGQQGKKVIVGFEVYPKSIAADGRNDTGLPVDFRNPERGMELRIGTNVTNLREKYPDSSYIPEDDDSADDNATLTIPYTYSIYFWEDTEFEWQNRWNRFFIHQEASSATHWLSIVNSICISGILTMTVAVIFARTIRGDIKGYRENALEEGKVRVKRVKPRSPRSPRKSIEKPGLLDQIVEIDGDTDISSDEESLEDTTGWKLVHGDVFRPPPYGRLLAPLIGSGMQLVFMAAGLLALSCFGVLNPSWRGGYISVGMGLFVFAGIFSGYFSSRVYKTFGGQMWRQNIIMTGTLIPGLLFTTIFILNLFVWAQASSTAIPFGTLIALLALWLLIQLPLVYVGGWYGYNRVGSWEHPIKSNVIPRQIPQQSWYAKSIQAIMLAGFLPFAVIFIELMFVFQSIWQDKTGYYYVFGFLAVISVILVIVVIEVTIVATYLQLCSENYHWWWQSFFVGGSSAVWMFLYCMWYYFTKLHITGFVSSMLFFSYSFLACAVYGLLTGTIGFLSAYAFVRRIYSAIKAD